MHLALITKLRCVLKSLVPITEKGNIFSDCEEGVCNVTQSPQTSSSKNPFTTSSASISKCSGKCLNALFVIVVVIVAMLVMLKCL